METYLFYKHQGRYLSEPPAELFTPHAGTTRNVINELIESGATVILVEITEDDSGNVIARAVRKCKYPLGRAGQ
jgi:hypothetical protein